jgi:putative ABC transport system permease protein
MVLIEVIAVGLAQLRANKLRSFLTLLGIMIGVAAVIGIVSLGEGLQRTLMNRFAQSGGATTVLISPPPQWEFKDGRRVRNPWTEFLTTDDLQAFHEETDRIRTALPRVSGGAQLQYGKTTMNSSFEGTSESFNEGHTWPVEMGRPLTIDDVRYARKVCMIGYKIFKDLFQLRSPLGEEIKINGERYTVVGVLEERVRFGSNEGDKVYIPYTTAQKRYTGNRQLIDITLFVESLEAVDEVEAAIRRVLRRRHEHGEEFKVITSRQEIENADRTLTVTKMVAGGIAGISLLVGGIGIMNIMLVSVTERTREIGVRKALGAKPGHLLLQFVAEAVVLSLVGGLLGIALGTGFGRGIDLLIHSINPDSPFASVVSLQSILWALLFASSVGLFFGIYPAFKAARMDPVEALRYE